MDDERMRAELRHMEGVFAAFAGGETQKSSDAAGTECERLDHYASVTTSERPFPGPAAECRTPKLFTGGLRFHSVSLERPPVRLLQLAVSEGGG